MPNFNFFQQGSSVSEETPSHPKRIIVCCDGTWQSSTSLDPKEGVESNVTRLCRVLAKAGTDQDGKIYEQIVYYDAGVGTGDISKYDKNRQGALGYGLSENVLEAYNFVVNNYKKGDEIFFFGFSRGAYTVRAAAGVIGTVGVVKPNSMGDLIKLYADWKQTSKPRAHFHEYPPWIQYTKDHPNYGIETKENTVIQVIGVWDTVGALGVPEVGHIWKVRDADSDDYAFHDTNLKECIKHAFQALALDERRPAFSPAAWRLKDNKVTKLLQCWFPGSHINCGGGNSANAGPNPQGDKEQLASISYAWMLDRIRPFLALTTNALNEQFAPLEELANTPYQPPASSGWWDWAKTKMSSNAGYSRGDIDNSFTSPYWFLTSPRDRTPNRYADIDAGEVTEEYVHPSVHFRQVSNRMWNEPVYEPAGMRGWIRVRVDDGVGSDGKQKSVWMWVKYKKDKPKEVELSMWEFEIGLVLAREMSLERRLVEGSWVDEGRFEILSVELGLGKDSGVIGGHEHEGGKTECLLACR